MSKRMKEFKGMNEAQLNERLTQIKMELVKYNTQVATGTAPKSPGLIRQAKRNVARILTILNFKKSEESKTDKSPSVKAEPAKLKAKETVTIKGDNAKSTKKKEELKKE